MPANRTQRPLHRRLQARISGPLIDRIDLRIEVSAFTAATYPAAPAEGSA